MNYFKTFMLMAGLTALFIWVGNYLGGTNGMLMAFGFAVIMNFSSYWFSDKIVLMTYGAKPITKEEAPDIYSMVRLLTNKAGLPMPKIYVVNERMPNAFATGRNYNHAVVAVTKGLVDMLDKKEVEAVLAHEISHIKNHDMLTGTIAATAAAAITMLARFAMFFGGRSDDREGGGAGALLMLILAPIAALLIQLMISRSMEYKADTDAAKLTTRPQDLISALEKIHGAAKKGYATHATPATQHLLIANPFTGGMMASLFSTHPTLEQRKKNLLNVKL
jgi:heat shock protein HtpX